jgi:TRAP-type C4-dicarboxylate transport system permease small subunit
MPRSRSNDGFRGRGEHLTGLERAARAVRLASELCGVAAALLLLAACGVVCQMVFVRSVLRASTIWQTEFVLYSVVAATLIGSPYVLARGGHVRVDFIARRAKGGAARALAIAASIAGISFTAVLAWSGWRYFYEAWSAGWATESVWAPPLWAVLLPLPLGVGLLTLQYAFDAARLLSSGPNGPGAATAESKSKRGLEDAAP